MVAKQYDSACFGLDGGTDKFKLASQHPIRPRPGMHLESAGEPGACHLGFIRSAYAECTNRMTSHLVGRDKFYGQDAVDRLPEIYDNGGTGRRRHSVEGFNGGFIFRAGRVRQDRPEWFRALFSYVLDAVPAEKLFVVYTLPPEDVIDQQDRVRMEEEGTNNSNILSDVSKNHPKIAGGGKIKKVAQNIAASLMCQDEIYKTGKRATIIDIGGGTTDLVAINVNPSQPFYLHPDYWINLKATEDQGTSTINIAGNYRDEIAQQLIEKKTGYSVGISFVRELMARYAFVDDEGFPQLRKVPVTGEFGEQREIDVFDEVREASMVIPEAIPIAIKTLASRFGDLTVRREVAENIFVTGHVASTKGLREVLEYVTRQDNRNSNVQVKILDDPLYAAARGALKLTQILSQAQLW